MKNVILTRDQLLKTMCKVLQGLQTCDIYVSGAYNTTLWNKTKLKLKQKKDERLWCGLTFGG